MKPLGIAIIGCGDITLQNHLPGLALCPEVKVVAQTGAAPAQTTFSALGLTRTARRLMAGELYVPADGNPV